MIDDDVQRKTQADYFDHIEDPEFETNRPHGESRLYRWVMDFKFREILRLLGRPLRGGSVLTVCCGSGMDAEMLASEGAKVVALDISHGALARARERAERFGARYALIQGDAGRLPFPDGAFDYTFVHDGLHHLPHPEDAVLEMARVARRGVLITEPADAALTNLLIRTRVLPAYEEAGNFVIRFNARSLAQAVAPLGFTDVRSSRYLFKYGHPPAPWWRRFDNPVAYAVGRALVVVLGVKLLGRVGNKIAFVALRASA